MLTTELIFGFFLGILASAVVVILYEYGTRPKLEIFIDESLRAQGQKPGLPPHEFYHLKASNLSALWPLPSRKPAWSCKVTLEVFDLQGHRVIRDAVVGRWTSRAEPLLPVLNVEQVANLLDPARLVEAQKIDIHNHEDQVFSITVKFDGSKEAHIFSNESYLFFKWQNPDWLLDQGEYRLKVTLYYERGRLVRNFRLANFGTNRSDLKIERW